MVRIRAGQRMTDEEQAPEQNSQSGNPLSCLATIGAVCVLAAALFLAGRESLLTLARSVTPAGQAIVQAQAQQEIEKARKIELENARRESDLIESRKRSEEFTRRWVRVIEVGLPVVAVVAGVAFVIIVGVVVFQSWKAAPSVREAVTRRLLLEAAKVHSNGHTRAFALMVIQNPDGTTTTWNPNIQRQPGDPVDDKLAQAFAYIQSLGVLADSAHGIAGRTSNPQSRAHEALGEIAAGVKQIAIERDDVM